MPEPIGGGRLTTLTLSVVIVTYHRAQDLEECLDSLFEMRTPPYEVIVVDSRSTDGTPEIAERYPLRFISIEEKSMVKARNVGLMHAEGDIVAYVDDDALFDENWSTYVVEPFKERSIGGAAGRVLPVGNDSTLSMAGEFGAIGKVYDNGLVLGNFDVPTEHPIEIDTVIGCNMSFRKSLLIETGGFDENLRGNCYRDDTDMSLRIKKLGYKLIYNPRAVVWHKYKGKTVTREWMYWTVYNHTYFYLKHFRPLTARKILSFMLTLFFPPREYMKKTGISIRASPFSAVYAGLGLASAVWVHRKGHLPRIPRFLGISQSE